MAIHGRFIPIQRAQPYSGGGLPSLRVYVSEE